MAPHLHSFYAPASCWQADVVRLPSDEAHHALRVVRLKDGDAVMVFDGQGGYAEGTLHIVSKASAEVHFTHAPQQTPPVEGITLAVGLLGSQEATQAVVSSATQLGAARIIFFPAAHSQRHSPQLEKWRRWAIETCKQCKRWWIPSLEWRECFDDVLKNAEGEVWVAAMAPAVEPIPRRILGCGSVTVVVGPEGDFTPTELMAAQQSGARLVSLGPFVLRSEVAALVALTLAQAARGYWEYSVRD